MFSQFKFVTGNPNKAKEASDILGVSLEQVEVAGLFEIVFFNLEEFASVSVVFLIKLILDFHQIVKSLSSLNI